MAATFVTSVPCRSHQQDNDEFCGMATVMMVLSALDPSVPPLSEEKIKGWITSTGTSNAPPSEVAGAIENHKPERWNGVTFAVSNLPCVTAANHVIVRALYDTRAPVATQVFGASHWLVVTGVLTDVDPVPGAEYELLGVFLNNPTPLAKPGPMAHTDTDACGNEPGCGKLDEFICTADWTKTWFTGTAPGTAQNAFVSVRGLGTPPHAAARVRTSHAGSRAGPMLDKATEAALDAIAHLGLDSRGPCAPILSNAEPSSAPPTGGGGYPYYVTLDVGGKPSASARVDDDYTFLGVAVTAPGGITPVRSARDMTAILLHRTFHVAGRDVQLTKDNFSVAGPLWRPSRESPSPYDPLYEVRIRGDQHVYYTNLAAERLHANVHWYGA